MAQSVPPGDIATQPGTKIVPNVSVFGKITRVTDVHGVIEKMMREDDPRVVGLKEYALIAVSSGVFEIGQKDTNNDRVTIEWTNTPDGAAKQFRREWFQ